MTVPQKSENSADNVLALINVAEGTHEILEPTTAAIRIDDLSAHRGDGIFETVLVTWRDGDEIPRVHSRTPHFKRFCESARALELPQPVQALWDEVLDATIAEFHRRNPDTDTISVRYTMTRGIDGDDGTHPTGWALTIPIPDKYAEQRRTGIRVSTLDKGYPAHFGQEAPWVLLGAKTLSYAVNQAAAREAARRGTEEALFVSHDGIVLEGPTSNLIVRIGNELITPDPKAGLLHGTTQQAVFRGAAGAGYDTSYADIPVEMLAEADALWMVSSVRTAVPIRAVDDREYAVDSHLTAEMHGWILDSSE